TYRAHVPSKVGTYQSMCGQLVARSGAIFHSSARNGASRHTPTYRAHVPSKVGTYQSMCGQLVARSGAIFHSSAR
ncbi:hypothetical protein C7E12_22750, partial [Stenotrophomonas maltophilia]